jgi:copper homeostasis protein (lipoprotein)
MFEARDARTLRRLDVSGKPTASTLNHELNRAAVFAALEPQLTMRGMYTYMADAGVFVDCATGWRLPVATEADNVALERGYQAARSEPGQPVLVALEGRIAMRPRMEGDGRQRTLVPIRFDKARPGDTCTPK